MSRMMVYRLQLFAILVALSTLLGVLDGYLADVSGEADIATKMYHHGITWFIGSSLIWGFEILFVPSRYGASIRRLYFLTAIALKSSVLVLIVVLVGLLGRAHLHNSHDISFLIEPQFFRTLFFVFSAIILIQTTLQVIRIIGGRTLINFVLGKYYRPIREEKIFMFLDLVGSTALAERLGDVGVQTMITKFFFDIDEPIIEYGGEIHRYVGDQVVVTWPLRAGEANMRAIQCCFAIARKIREKALEYQREFGIAPSYRIGLHGGPVVISQCGDQKQEISYFGDTVNTAARIEQQCKALDCPLLISSELLSRVTLPTSFQIQSKGTVILSGREKETELFTIINGKQASMA
jgi:adenylate cyclase